MACMRGSAKLLCLIGAACVMTGCRPTAEIPGDPGLAGGPARQGEVASMPVVLASAGAPPSAAPRVGALTMRGAMYRAVEYSPVLRALGDEIGARKGEAFQAGLRPNPQLGVEVENFGGSGDYSGFDSAETTISLSQVIELGGKRMKRLRLAEADIDLAAWDYEAARLATASQTLQAFIDVLASQKRLAIHREFAASTSRFADTVSERVEAGKVSPVEKNRAIVQQANASIAVDEEEAALDVARRKLALFWGARSPDFGQAVGQLAATNHLPPPERFEAYLDRNPAIARWADEVSRRHAALELERAKRIPDLTVGAGVRHYEDTDDTAAVASISIGLPFFDRNSGNIDAASARVSKSIYEQQAASIEIRTRFVEAYGSLRAAEAKLRALQDKVLPAARSAYEATAGGYREGKFDLLNVLDAQRDYLQTQRDVVNTQAEFHKAKAVIEGLIGRDLYSL